MTLKDRTRVDQYCQQWLTIVLLTTGMTAGLVGRQLVGHADDTGETPSVTQSAQSKTQIQAKSVPLSQTSAQPSASSNANSSASSQSAAPTSDQGSATSQVSSDASGNGPTNDKPASTAPVSTTDSDSVPKPTSEAAPAVPVTQDAIVKTTVPSRLATTPRSRFQVAATTVTAPDVTLPATGQYGTAKWDIDATGVLTIHQGQTGNASASAPDWLNYADQVTSVVVEAGVVANPNAQGLFGNLKNVTKIDLTQLDTSNTLNMMSFFAGDEKLISVDLSNLNTSKVQNLSSFFEGDTALTSVDLSHFNTAQVQNLSKFFKGDENLVSIDLSNFDTVQVQDMSSLFEGDKTLNKLNLSHFDTSAVTTMTRMFAGCQSLPIIDVSSFNTANVTDMSYMFSDCGEYYQQVFPVIKYSDNFVTTHVTTMQAMFYGSAFLNLDITKQFDTTNVTTMADMFAQVNWIKTLDVSGFNTAKVSNMSEMFYYSHELTGLNLSNFDTHNVTNMSGMFEIDRHLKTLDISNFDTSNVTDMSSMFEQVGLENLDLSTNVVKNFTTEKVTNMMEMFLDSGSLKTLTLGDFRNPNVYNFNRMFEHCTALETINGWENFGTSAATMMSMMFGYDTSLKTIDLSHFDTRNVETMRFMFYQDSALTDANLSGLQFDKDVMLTSLFYGCTSLTSVDLTGIKTNNGATITGMFYNCSRLPEVDISAFNLGDTAEQTSVNGYSRTYETFTGCTALWKLTLGPQVYLATDTELPDAPGNQTAIVDGNTTYLNIGPYWQLVDDGNAHTPVASDHHPEGELLTAAQIMATDSNYQQARTYVWQQSVPATVTIQYLDEQQKVLQPDQTFRGVVGDTYQVGGLSRMVPDLDLTRPTIAGYTFKEQQGETPDGTLHSPQQVVTYVYARTLGAPVTVTYVDDTNNTILDTATLTGPLGDAYQSAAKTFTGYTLVTSPEQSTGTFIQQPQTLTYHYTQDPVMMGTLTIKYQDQTGQILAPAETVTQALGTTYQSTPLKITGYQVSQIMGQPMITFSSQPQAVTYIYEPVIIAGAPVTVNYVDTMGTTLATSQLLTGRLGSTYTTTALVFPHYQLKRIYGAAQGSFTATAQTVTYEYQYQSLATLTGQDYTMYVGDVTPVVANFHAQATDDTGHALSVTVDFGQHDLTQAGDYQVKLSAAKQTKLVWLHVLTNQQRLTARDYSMTLGGVQPQVNDFDAQATDKMGRSIAVTVDFSHVDFTQAGRYQVTLNTTDGQHKLVSLNLVAPAPIDPEQPATPDQPVVPVTPTPGLTPTQSVPVTSEPEPTPGVMPTRPTAVKPQPMVTSTKRPVTAHKAKPVMTHSGVKTASQTSDVQVAKIHGQPGLQLSKAATLSMNKARPNLPKTQEHVQRGGLIAGLVILLGTLGTWFTGRRH